MAQHAETKSKRPQAAKDAELARHYRQIGSAAILGALAVKMKQAADDTTEVPARGRKAA
jgi:hypothetical protein